jgi:signal peptidase I
MNPKKTVETDGNVGHVDIPRRGMLAEWTVTIILLLFGTTTLVQAFVIPTGSMKESLLIGDHLLVDKLAYAPAGSVGQYILPYQQVQRGDIIVFRYPRDLSQTYVKRAVGIPGDRIRMVNKQLFISGEPVAEPYVSHNTSYVEAYRDNFPATPDVRVYQRGQVMLENHVVGGEVVVPPGQYFAMGDNRDSSDDSRFWGFVPRENIIGKPLIIYWSYDAPTHRLQDSSISVAHIKDLVLNFFSKTRWGRTFNLIHSYELTAP